jgi:hypothetical protein
MESAWVTFAHQAAGVNNTGAFEKKTGLFMAQTKSSAIKNPGTARVLFASERGV